LKEWGDEEEGTKHPSAEELAAIPEASSEQSTARRSKRQVEEVDEEVGVMAERRKPFQNEGNFKELNSSSIVQDSMFISNLKTIGISLGDDVASISKSMINIREQALGSVQERAVLSVVDKVVEKEEKELLEEEELEKLFLKNICSEIMEEVMRLEGDYDVVPPRGYDMKKSNRKGKKHKKI
jgi:hypothetical protein